MRTLALATALLALGCSPAPTDAAKTSADQAGSADALPDRDPALAKKLVEEEHAVLLDVRTPEEYAEGNLEGSVNIPHDQIDAKMAEIETLTSGDKGHAIVLYCRSGARAGKAKAALQAAGYTRVTNVGGMTDYPE